MLYKTKSLFKLFCKVPTKTLIYLFYNSIDLSCKQTNTLSTGEVGEGNFKQISFAPTSPINCVWVENFLDAVRLRSVPRPLYIIYEVWENCAVSYEGRYFSSSSMYLKMLNALYTNNILKKKLFKYFCSYISFKLLFIYNQKNSKTYR